MMDWMIKIEGVTTHSEITAYYPKKYINSDCRLDIELVLKEYTGFLYIGNLYNNTIKYAALNRETPIVFITTESPSAIIKPICNVEVKVVRDYNIIGWIEFGIRTLYNILTKRT